MNCGNCGASMVLLEERDYFFCKYCGSFEFPEVSESGIRLLDEDPKGSKCPSCYSLLKRASIAKYRMLSCAKCRGLLMRRPVFGGLVLKLRAEATGPPVAPPPVKKQALLREVGCPSCGSTMLTHPYYGPGNIVIDTCDGCDLVWLDFGELDSVINAPGRDRGDLRKLLGDWLEVYS